VAKLKPWVTADCETNPFKYGDIITPFIWAVFDGTNTKLFDGVNATADFIAWARDFDGYIYAHNGGRFDWMMADMMRALDRDEDIFIINNRIAKAKLGKAQLRDSFLILPVPLKTFEKKGFNYSWLVVENRAQHMDEIREYITSDVVNLYAPLAAYFAKYGQQLTQAGAAMKEWHNLGGEKRKYGKEHDTKFRPFYFGGRCEVFQYLNGVADNWKVYDINSSYPNAMCSNHPLGKEYFTTNNLKDLVGGSFWTIKAISRGALPIRKDDGGVMFPNDETPRTFKCTGWEIMAGVDTNTLDVLDCVGLVPYKFESMQAYVHKHYAEKEQAGKIGDKVTYTIAKIFLNSLYGKFSMDIESFKDYRIFDGAPADGWELPFMLCEGGDIYYRKSTTGEYIDVACGASITGLARANLWRGICESENVAYCDTDSIFCTGSTVPCSHKLGDWEMETEAKRLWIAGKKMYSLEYTKPKKNGDRYKVASKGVTASHDDIRLACDGYVVELHRDAPTFKLDGSQRFISRKIKMT